MVREEKIVAYMSVKWTCDEPGCGDFEMMVNPTPAERMAGPRGWSRRNDGTTRCPSHALKSDAW